MKLVSFSFSVNLMMKRTFTFGTAQGSKVVLKSPDWEDQDSISYSNLSHMELYPYPGRDAIVLYNPSTSDFTVCSLAMPLDDKLKAIPQGQVTLDRGTWQLTLGKGWSFQIKLLSRPPVVFNGVLISPTELTRAVDRSSKATRGNASSSKTSSKAKTEAANVAPLRTSFEGHPLLNVSDVGVAENQSIMTNHTVKTQTIAPAVEGQSVVIGQTDLTQVVKVIRHGKIVAIKASRRLNSIEGAKVWLNGKMILKDLKHASPAH